MNIIEASNLSKKYLVPIRPNNFKEKIRNIFVGKYKSIIAVDNINIKVNTGEIVGYIGLNGAGKSTTIKLLTGILTPTSGEVRLFNKKIQDNRIIVNKQMGVVFGQRTNLWYDLPVIESYKYIKNLYEINDTTFNNNLENIVTTLEIKDLLHIPVRKLSLGQKMKCELGAVFLYEPKVVFLDEPTIGLDVFAKAQILECIKNLRDKIKTSIIITTHNIDEIEKICDRIIVIDKGKILFEGDLDSIKKLVGDEYSIIFTLTNFQQANFSTLFEIGCNINMIASNKVEVIFDHNSISQVEIIKFFLENFIVEDLVVNNSNLEKLIKKLYENEKLQYSS